MITPEELNLEKFKSKTRELGITMELVHKMTGISRQYLHFRFKCDQNARTHWIYQEICNYLNTYQPTAYKPLHKHNKRKKEA